MNESVNGKWSQVDNQLQRRNDLIPNLVATVQGMAKQERRYQSVTDARAKTCRRSRCCSESRSKQWTECPLALISCCRKLSTIKSDASFRQLADELAGTKGIA